MQADVAYRKTTDKGFAEAVQAVEEAVAQHGFRVMCVHDVQETFRSKGVQRDPLKIIEVCNVKYAKQALDKDLLIGLMMPCKINVYEQQEETKISLMLPTALPMFFPDAKLEPLAEEVENILRKVVDDAK